MFVAFLSTHGSVEENAKKENGLRKSSPVNIEDKPIILSYADAVRKK